MPPAKRFTTLLRLVKVTSIDRDARTRRYLISMTIRTLCFPAAILVDGYRRWVLFAAAVVLPYIAVVVPSTIIRPPSPVSDAPAHHQDTGCLSDTRTRR